MDSSTLIISASDVVERTYEQEPVLIKEIWRQGENFLITGHAGIGKSSLALNLAINLASAQPFLGKYRIPEKKRVLIVQAEMSAPTVQERLKCIAVGTSSPDVLKQIYFMSNDHDIMAYGNIQSSEFRENLKQALNQSKAEICIVDPISSFLGGNISENDNLQVRHCLDTFSMISRKAGSSLVVVHHHGKNSQDGQYAARGASAFADWAATNFTCNRSSNRQIKNILGSWSKIRSFKPQPDIVFGFDENFCCQEVEPNVMVPPLKVVEILKAMGGKAKSKNKLADEIHISTGASRTTAMSAIGEAEMLGKIESKKNGQNREFYIKSA